MTIAIGEKRNAMQNIFDGRYRLRGRRPHCSGDTEDRIADRVNSCSRLEMAFTAAMLFYTTGAVVPLVTGGAEQLVPSFGQPPPPVALATKLCIYACALLLVARRWRIVIQGVKRIRWILLPVLIAVLSIVWSQALTVTLRSVPVLLGTTVFGVYFGIRYSVPQQLRLLAGVFSAIILLSIVFAIFLPGYGIDIGATTGDWRGVFIQKNGLAEMMVLAFFVFFFSRPERHTSLRWLGLSGSLVLIALSRSATGIIVCVALLAAVPLYRLARVRFNLVIPTGLLLLVLLAGFALVVDGHAAGTFALVGRNQSLTGRTGLWRGVIAAIANRPWLGYGFSAFWTGMKGPSGLILESIGWMAGYAHNGFLDLMLQLGLVGLITYIAGYLFLWKRAIRLLRRSANVASLWMASFLTFMLLYNLTEGSILGQDSISWLLYISTAVGILAPRLISTHTEDLAVQYNV